MRNLVKYFGVSLLVMGLAACDGQSDTKTADNAGQTSTSQNEAGKTISLMDGKFSLTLPAGMTDKSDKLSTQVNNMRVYADESGQKAVITMEVPASNDKLSDLAKRMIDQQQLRSPQLQVVTNKEITVGTQSLQQLDTVLNVNGQSAWSSVVMGKVAGTLFTLQVTLPSSDQQAAQTEAASILQTLQAN